MLAASSQGPFLEPPAFKPLQGDLTGAFSRRLNYQHRIVHRVFEPAKEAKILEMWTDYKQSKIWCIINIMLKIYLCYPDVLSFTNKAQNQITS